MHSPKLSLSLTVASACQAGVFAVHDPTFIVDLLTKRKILGKASKKRSRS